MTGERVRSWMGSVIGAAGALGVLACILLGFAEHEWTRPLAIMSVAACLVGDCVQGTRWRQRR